MIPPIRTILNNFATTVLTSMFQCGLKVHGHYNMIMTYFSFFTVRFVVVVATLIITMHFLINLISLCFYDSD